MSQIHTEIAVELQNIITNLENWHCFVHRDENLNQAADLLKEVLEELS